MTGWTLALACAGLSACAPSNAVKPGAPELQSFSVVDSHGQTVELAPETGPVLVSPRSSFVAVFDRLLDPTPLEEVSDAGVSGKAGAATLQAAGNPMAAVTYIPNGDGKFHLLFAPGPTLMIMPTPTLPSGSTVTVSLDGTKVRSRDGKTAFVTAMGAKSTLTFQTEPFAAAIALPDSDPDAGAAALDRDFTPVITFNNLMAADVNSHVKVAVVGKDGQPVADAAEVKPSADDPASLVVTPKNDMWPAEAKVTITVDADARDALNMKLAEPVSVTFTTKP